MSQLKVGPRAPRGSAREPSNSSEARLMAAAHSRRSPRKVCEGKRGRRADRDQRVLWAGRLGCLRETLLSVVNSALRREQELTAPWSRGQVYRP
jgi:hypothetical protein